MFYPYGPIHGEIGKECRYTQFGKELAANGFSVVWWTSNFSHADKKIRCNGWKDIEVTENFLTRLVPTSTYKKNVSLGRIIFEKKFAQNLLKKFKEIEKPDLIIVAGTGMFNAFEPCCSYANKYNIPIIYDIMDIPLVETYMSQNHKLFAPIVKAVMTIERKREEKFFKSIDGICALGKNQLEYARHRAFDRDIPTALIYNGINVNAFREMMDNAKKFKKKEGWIFCVFSGALGPSYDIETIINCAKKCEANGDKISFIIAGKGPQEILVEETSKTCNNLDFIGYVSLERLASLYKCCDVGLCSFAECSTVDMPDKFYDYCAGGLAILNTLHGEVKDYILKNGLGEQYEAGNEDDLYKHVRKFYNLDYLNTCKSNSFKCGMNFDITNQVKKLSNLAIEILADN